MDLSIKNLNFSYGDLVPNQVPLFFQASIDFPVHKTTVFLGRSGCGKTTLLRILAGLIPLSPDQARSIGSSFFSQKTSMVFQSPHLLPYLSVRENILLPLKVYPGHDLNDQKSEKETKDLIRFLGLEGTEEKYPHELSGGQKMRVAFGRSLILHPEILFLDEPFAALDEFTREDMQNLFFKMKEQFQLTCLFVTHSLTEASKIADQVVLFSEQGLKTIDLKTQVIEDQDKLIFLKNQFRDWLGERK